MITMKDQIVSFKTAILADEKGLNLIWKNDLYTDDGVQHPYMAHWLCGYSKMYNAPTQSILQKWLREIHKIEIDIRSVIAGYEYSIWKRSEQDEDFNWFDSSETYEDALEKALVRGLNMIETIKTEKE